MNFSQNNFRYKKIQNNILIRNENYQSIFQKPTYGPSINTMNSYTGKNYSSIKSLIRRLQASGQTKINYPRIKTRNQRNDIFLRGGSINQVKKISYLQNSKPSSKNIIYEKRKIQTRCQQHSHEDFLRDQMDSVYISRNIPIQMVKALLSKSNQTVKTEVPRSNSHKIQNKIFQQRGIEQKMQEETHLRQFTESLEEKEKQLLKNQEDFPLYETNRDFGTLQHQSTQKPACHKKTVSQSTKQTNQTFTPVTMAKQSKRPKMSTCILKSTEPKPEHKKSCSQIQTDTKKPLFYLSQDELRQLNITAKNFIVMEFPSRQIITGAYMRQVGQIASLTKIITFYCCLLIIEKYELDMDKEMLIVDQQVQETTGTSAQLLEGDKLTFRQICYGLMLPSGNDAALAMAKWAGKILKKQQTQSNLKIFMTFMNSTCNSIGMKSSFFGNPHGLPHPKSGSTAEDVAIVINEALRFPFFREVIKTKQFKCWVENGGVNREVRWENTHKLLRRPGFIGVKTGVTVTAGPCLSTCYEIDGKIYTIVVLKTSKPSRRFKQTRRILGKVLSKLNLNLYRNQIRAIQKNDAELDSDNSEDEQEFNYQRNDAQQMKKRLKIITYQM